MKHDSYPLISYDLIKAATEGDNEIINQITEHYRPYFSKLSLVFVKDEYGNSYQIVDEVLRNRLENRLIMMILNFEIRKQ